MQMMSHWIILISMKAQDLQFKGHSPNTGKNKDKTQQWLLSKIRKIHKEDHFLKTPMKIMPYLFQLVLIA